MIAETRPPIDREDPLRHKIMDVHPNAFPDYNTMCWATGHGNFIASTEVFIPEFSDVCIDASDVSTFKVSDTTSSDILEIGSDGTLLGRSFPALYFTCGAPSNVDLTNPDTIAAMEDIADWWSIRQAFWPQLNDD